MKIYPSPILSVVYTIPFGIMLNFNDSNGSFTLLETDLDMDSDSNPILVVGS